MKQYQSQPPGQPLWMTSAQSQLRTFPQAWPLSTAKVQPELPQLQLGQKEREFAELLWDTLPASSGVLVAVCEKAFNWKKSTTYTMLKRLCQRGIFRNMKSYVFTIIERDAYYAMQGEAFIEYSFSGSLSNFLFALFKHKRPSLEELASIQRLVDQYRQEWETTPLPATVTAKENRKRSRTRFPSST